MKKATNTAPIKKIIPVAASTGTKKITKTTAPLKKTGNTVPIKPIKKVVKKKYTIYYLK